MQTTNDHNYPVLAEALEDGAFSLTGGMSMLGYQGGDIHDAPTVTLMRTTGSTIVQTDTAVDPPLVPIAREFGGQAGQMLAPLHYQGEFSGFIAVHGHGDPRNWSEDDQQHLRAAVAATEALLASASWFDRPLPAPVKHVMVVLSDPVEGRENEYNEWYSGQHLRETLQTPGWSAARRFVLAKDQLSEHLPKQKYLAVYELSTDDPADALAALRGRSDAITPSESISPDDVVAVFTPITDRIERT
ncbi:GAF domain-containing protein [Rhodococcus jostii]|uniref:GAF domain-containing protein n=1 Tax=Rhodococcus jostii TaxID=132919 RepID=A0ABU4CSN9_RHOJO|nr:GAF domain-containing protein [Rhodococcus jostii]MDV6286473.1 GAF domain-containing protein [Rhodococcus jostii]